MLETDFVFWVFYDDPLPLCPSQMFNFKQLENLERILLLKAGVVPVDVHLHLDLHHEVHNKVQHCSVFSCTFNVQNIWFGRGSQSSRPIRDQITFHQWGERITIRCPDPLSELQISRGYSCSPFAINTIATCWPNFCYCIKRKEMLLWRSHKRKLE